MGKVYCTAPNFRLDFNHFSAHFPILQSSINRGCSITHQSSEKEYFINIKQTSEMSNVFTSHLIF